MENGIAINVLDRKNVNLRFISEMNIILQDVQHVLDIRRNLINGSLLVQLGYKIVLESNKIVIFKSDIFIIKGFISKELFKLNIIINENSFSNPFQFILLNSKSYNI